MVYARLRRSITMIIMLNMRAGMAKALSNPRAAHFSTTTAPSFSDVSPTTSLPSSNATAVNNAIQNHLPFFPIYYNDVYEVNLPPNHRFPMQKYRQSRELVQRSIRSSDIANVRTEFLVSPLATRQELETTHCPEYIERYLTGDLTERELRNVGFPWSQQSVNRSLSSTGGTIAAAVDVIREWSDNRDKLGGTYCGAMAPWGAQIAGGTHHAFRDRGEGFCVFSDIAVAANVVLQRFPDVVRRILVLDLDVHQGNGNAVLFQNDPRVFTFSMHCDKNYFSKKEQSDLDIELPEGCNDATYLTTLNHWLKRLRTEMGSDEFQLVFYQAGVDVLDHDRLGRMSLTLDGVRRRNELVYQFARDLNVPLVITMGGGYPRTDDWEPIITAHADVYLQALSFLNQVPAVSASQQ